MTITRRGKALAGVPLPVLSSSSLPFLFPFSPLLLESSVVFEWLARHLFRESLTPLSLKRAIPRKRSAIDASIRMKENEEK